MGMQEKLFWRSVVVTLTEPMLGTLSGNKDLARDFIFSKFPGMGIPKDEEDSHPQPEDELEKISTMFARDEGGRPVMWDYQIRGFFKAAAGALKRSDKKELALATVSLSAHKKVIDQCVFVRPRRIVVEAAGDLSWCQRPLRAQTAQGERVALARSETVPEGSVLRFEIGLLSDKLWVYTKEWLDYGELCGLGQWRNASFGRFSWQLS